LIKKSESLLFRLGFYTNIIFSEFSNLWSSFDGIDDF